MTRGVYGRLPRTEDRRDYLFRAPRPYLGEFVDLSSQFPGVPYDQGQLGSCVSNGTAAIVDFARQKQGLHPLLNPSRLFLYYQGRVRSGQPIDQDTGLEVRDGLTVAAKDGAPPEADWPYDVARFTQKPPGAAYTDARGDVATVYGAVDAADIDSTIASGYGILQGFQVFESFESSEVAATGIVPMPRDLEAEVGGHCTVIVSTPKDGSQIPGGIPGVRYRRHLNSWGPGWGDGGFYWAPVELTDKYADDFWMLTAMSDPHGPTPPAPPPHSVALDVAARALATDVQVLHWALSQQHSGAARHVAALVRAVIKAA